MTEAQLDLQHQLEQTITDLITQPLFNDSPVLFLQAMDQDQPNTISEQIEHNTVSPKGRTPPEISNDNSRESPPPLKKKYEIMKDPAFLSSPVYPTFLPQNFHSLQIEMTI